jgi:hypothetical protein
MLQCVRFKKSRPDCALDAFGFSRQVFNPEFLSDDASSRRSNNNANIESPRREEAVGIFCSIFAPLREGRIKPLKTGWSVSHSADAIAAKFFISNSRSISQAGRRGFDPRLPLHEINNLFTQ